MVSPMVFEEPGVGCDVEDVMPIEIEAAFAAFSLKGAGAGLVPCLGDAAEVVAAARAARVLVMLRMSVICLNHHEEYYDMLFSFYDICFLCTELKQYRNGYYQ